MRIWVIINAWKASRFLPLCLASLRMQTYSDWRAVVTVDEATNEDSVAAEAAVDGDARISLVHCARRLYVLQNTALAVRNSEAAPEDIVAILDGDDWLARVDALELVARAHRAGAWVTYGSWVSNHRSQDYPSRLPAYPEGVDLRWYPWLATAMRTFRRGLFDRIRPEDLGDEQGRYFRCCPDPALMLPAMEMAGPERVTHIPEPIYFYNRDYGGAVADTRRREQEATAALIRSRPPYERLEAL